MNRLSKVLLQASGLKLLYKLAKRASMAGQRVVAGRLKQLGYSSERLGPPKGLVTMAEYAAQTGAYYKELSLQEERSHPVQEFKESGKGFQIAESEAFAPVTLIPSHVAILESGRVYGPNGLVITSDDRVIWETIGSYRGYAKTHPIFYSVKLPKLTCMSGRLATVGYNYGHGYYHWMLEVLPRLEILRQAKMSFDQVYMNPITTRFQAESLLAADFDHSRALWASDKTHVKAEKLIVPSLPSSPGQIPHWVCSYLRRLFLAEGSIAQTEKLLISRRKAARRRIVNEKQLWDNLKPLGFQEVVLEDYSIREQARLFASAKVIVGTHGAALTNLVFCSPNTQVVELFAPTRTYNNFHVLSHIMGLRYHGLLTLPNGLSRNAIKKQDLVVDPTAFAQFLSKAGIV